MTRWNLTAMGQSGLTGVTTSIAKPIAASIARKTGRPEGQVLAIIGAVAPSSASKRCERLSRVPDHGKAGGLMASVATIEEAARLLGLTVDEVYRLVGTGELDAVVEIPGESDALKSSTLSHLRIDTEVLSAYRARR